MIVDPGTGGVLSCVLETETTVRNQTQKQETEEQEQSQINKSSQIARADNKSDSEGTARERNNPRKNNFSSNPGNFPEHYIFLTRNH